MTDSLLSRLLTLRWEPTNDAVAQGINAYLEAATVFSGDPDRAQLAKGFAVDADRLKAEVLHSVEAHMLSYLCNTPDDPLNNAFDGAIRTVVRDLRAAADTLAPATD